MILPAPDVQNHGEVFTRRWVVEVLLDLTGYTAGRDLGRVHLLEPSCGSGAFLGPVVERLIASAQRLGRDLASLGDAIRAYDLQAEHVQACRALCCGLLTAAGEPVSVAANLAACWVRHADFLLTGQLGEIEGHPEIEERPADVVIGNPPYIRYDDLADDVVTLYRSAWPTMQGRGDIYIGFFERSLRMLKPDGKVGFICADRWMRNAYGAALRRLVASRYAVEHVWTMHDVNAFKEQVSAYPAITVLGNHAQGTAVVADTTAAFGASSAAALALAVKDEAFTHFSGTGVTAHLLPHWFGNDDFWPTGSPARLALLEDLKDRFEPLHDPATGTKVSIGVATGADKVYVTRDATVAEPDRVLPLAMREDLMSGTFEWQGNYLVNPWANDGSLVQFADYPRMAAYLSGHPALKERHVAKRSPGTWYRTIDKVQASLTSRPKLLLQDMKAHIHPVLEPGGYYPHHNLYYVVSDTWDLEVLGGILLSRIAQAFIEAYCVRMRGGTLRFQAQYLKRIRVPRPAEIDADIEDALRTAFRARDAEAATQAAAAAYGIDLNEHDLAPFEGGENAA
ncbi:MAG TPA: Eco57I restriction-modification methylase domain-containing protein [Streptosporangiaceae bacterium]|nr:Eco57I restriction-modification methylase domain-containing protein [Streptosporangiaceae bacterium]